MSGIERTGLPARRAGMSERKVSNLGLLGRNGKGTGQMAMDLISAGSKGRHSEATARRVAGRRAGRIRRRRTVLPAMALLLGVVASMAGVAAVSPAYAVSRPPANARGTTARASGSSSAWSVDVQKAAAIPGVASMSCGSATNCVAVGANYAANIPVVIYTTNGGASWQRGTPPAGMVSLTDVSCASATICMATGSSSTSVPEVLAQTTNGGATWTSNKNLPGNVAILNSVSCASVLGCAVTGLAINSGGESPYIGTTSDLGFTWATDTAPSADKALGAISCTGAGTCVALGGTSVGASPTQALYASSASLFGVAGVTWSTVALPSGVGVLSDVSCASATDCWIVGSTNASPSTPLIIYSGGSLTGTWQTQAPPTGGISLTQDSCVSSVSSPGAFDCVGIGQTGTPLSGAGFQGVYVIYNTNASTGAWSHATSPAAMQATAAVSCATGAVLCGLAGLTSVSLTLDGSSNGGSTWTNQPAPQGWGLNTLSCPSASECIAGGYSSTGADYSLRTVDAGTTWQVGGSASSQSFSATSCANANDCMAVVTGGSAPVVVTTNGGVSWSSSGIGSFPNNQSQGVSLSGVACITQQDCIVVGALTTIVNNKPVISPWISPTTNGGSSWSSSSIPSGSAALVQQVSCGVTSGSASSVCVAIGFKTLSFPLEPSLLVSTDGGSSWTAPTLPSGIEMIQGVSCSTAEYCMAEGFPAPGASSANVVLIQTMDGGSSWTSVPVPSNLEMVSGISCVANSISKSDCIVVGQLASQSGASGPAAFVTTNSGLSWGASESMPSTIANISAVTCVAGSTECYLLGYSSANVLIASDQSALLPVKPTTPVGYWLVASDGGIFSFGVPFYGSMGGKPLNKPIVGMTATSDGKGYWFFASDGGIFSFGDATFHGSMGGKHLNAPIVGMAADPATGGYWEVASDGGIFAFGAPFFGSMGGKHLNAPIVGMTATPDGKGYWFVASDGGIFSFGNAQFHGSMGGRHLNQPIVGMANDPATGGYWMVAGDGGVFAFDAPFFGSMGGRRLNAPIVGMTATPDGMGYWFVASDGGIFSYGDGKFFGSMGGKPLNKPIVGMAAG